MSLPIITYSAPSAPLLGTSRFPGRAGYTRRLRCASKPRRPLSGSVLLLFIPSRHVALYDPGVSVGCMHPVPSPTTLAFVHSAGTRHAQYPHCCPLPVGPTFRGYQFAFATTCRVACLPRRTRPGFRLADRDFYFRASDGLVTLPAAGYDYGGNWASSTGRSSTCWNDN